jgi:hypothetical protein
VHIFEIPVRAILSYLNSGGYLSSATGRICLPQLKTTTQECAQNSGDRATVTTGDIRRTIGIIIQPTAANKLRWVHSSAHRRASVTMKIVRRASFKTI